MKTHTVLITGATSGIGAAIARRLAFGDHKHTFRLILCGRRQERLDALQDELSKQTEVTTLNFDVRDKVAVFEAIQSLPPNFQEITMLVNNAGNAHGRAALPDAHLEDWDLMMDGNVKGLLYVTKAVLPQMVERQDGFILNIGSIAGREVYPNGNVYCASKHAVSALSEGMRMDLFKHNIRVSEIKPGMVETEFSLVRFKGNAEEADKVYADFTPLQAEDIADLAHFILTRPAHVNLADTLILATDQASSALVNRHGK